ncbi:YwhD family protein [Bacillus sp. EAC]|uniref:YwhD family protein n=1 Tax=Bacillus sp. EAC TaxID=1978338 RepID=UPI000B453C75|nr:YwhD family protein [Bacillus sp. EAC]
MSEQPKKKSLGFNILKNDSTSGHGGYGVGAISLENVSPVFVDIQENDVFVDIGAMHARSSVEKGIKFLTKEEDVPNGKPYWLVWVATERNETGPYYAGVTGCYMTVDREARRGYKLLPDHVNKMDKAMKRKIMVDHMDETSRKLLSNFLKSHNEEMWNNSSADLKNDLLG